MELPRGMFGDAQAKNAGLDQLANIAQRTAAFEPAGRPTGGVKPGSSAEARMTGTSPGTTISFCTSRA